MFSKMINIFVASAILVFLSACGDMKDTEVVKKGLDSSQFALSCPLDPNKFHLILEENISSQINCLGESLNLFVDVVKSDKPGYLSRVQLEKYLADFRQDVKPDIIKALKSVFKIGHLITGEDPEYISKETIGKVVKFALLFNEEAALTLGPIFQNDSPVSYALHQNHRERVSDATKKIVSSIREIFNENRNGEIHKLDIIELMESFTSESNRESIEKAKKFLFIKKVIFGGESDILTHNELEKLFLNLDHLILIGLDITRFKNIILKQDLLIQLLKRDVDDLYEIMLLSDLENRGAETFFTMDQLVDAAKVFLTEDDFDIEKFRSLLGEVKKIVVKGNATEMKGSEVKSIFDQAKALLQSGTVFHRIYEKFKTQLDSPNEVTIDFSDYRHTYPEHQADLNQFERIVNAKNYRYMKGELFSDDNERPFRRSAYYTRELRRNPDAFFEIALFEYGLKLVFEAYGSKSPNADAVGGYSIDKDQMRKVLKKFENELIDLDLITPQRAIMTADNISLLGSLFQNQSDKNGVMDVNEATEFGLSLFTAINISDDIHTYFKDQNCAEDKFNRVEPSCYRANFLKGFCKYYRSYYPLFFQSLNAPQKCEEFDLTPETSDFLNRSILAARTCNYYNNPEKEEIYYSKSDTMTIILALVHAETTVLRWDLNKNNIMDSDEVNKAYEIYSPALDGLLQGKNPTLKKFKKQIFQYIIKYEQVPDEKNFGSIWKFIKFLVSFNKKSSANRRTILSVLMAISEENMKLQEGPKFNCDLMRDPTTIPRQAEFESTSQAIDTREDFSSILIPYLHLAK